MRLFKVILAAVIALSPMAPSLASAQGKPGGAIDTQGEMMTLLSKLVAWTASSNEVIQSSTLTAMFIIEGANRAIGGEMTPEEGRAWVAEWLPQADAKVAELKAQAAALTPLPTSISQPYKAVGGPMAARQVTAVAKLPGLAQNSATVIEQYLAELRPLIIKAAGGDADAKVQLARRVIGGSRLRLANENAMLDVSLAMATQEDHPQVQLVRSIQLTNEALSIAYSVLERDLDPTTGAGDAVAAGKAMKAKLAQARSMANLIPTNAKKLAARVRGEAGPGPLRDAVLKMLASYDDSAAVELKLIVIMEAVADDLQNPLGYDLDRWDFDGIEPLAQQRMDLQLARAAVLKR